MKWRRTDGIEMSKWDDYTVDVETGFVLAVIAVLALAVLIGLFGG